jgi:putative hydrolase of the HAD superfamily
LKRVWIFDLDDTLHDASQHIFPIMNRAMTQYIMDTLDMDETSAQALRRHYWRIYGATLKGLVRHHGTDPHHFLAVTHDVPDLAGLAQEIKGLRHMLQQLPGRKVVFTNAPMRYALRVLAILGIRDMFEHIYSVESSQFHPKPAVRGFKRLLRIIGAQAKDCVMLEDNAPTLMTAKRLGMRTVLVGKTLHKPSYVNKRINNILKLNRISL